MSRRQAGRNGWEAALAWAVLVWSFVPGGVVWPRGASGPFGGLCGGVAVGLAVSRVAPPGKCVTLIR